MAILLNAGFAGGARGGRDALAPRSNDLDRNDLSAGRGFSVRWVNVTVRGQCATCRPDPTHLPWCGLHMHRACP